MDMPILKRGLLPKRTKTEMLLRVPLRFPTPVNDRARCAVLAVLLCSVPAASTSAQSTSSYDRASYPQAWLSASAGVGSGIGQPLSGSAGVSANAGLPGHGLLGQLAVNGVWPTYDRFEGETSSPYRMAVSAGLGRVWATTDLAAAVVAGPAVAWGRPTYRAERYVTGGAVFAAQFFVTPAMAWGIGLDLLATATPRGRTVGIRFAFQLGSARPH